MNPSSFTDPLDLRGRVALVSGGGGGIGRALIKQLSSQGAQVAFTYVEGAEDPGEVISELGLEAQGVTSHSLDLRSSESIRHCVASVVDQHGGIDILVNNAAVGSATVASWSQNVREQDALMLSINAGGTLQMCQEFQAAPGTGPRKLINISSVGGGIATFAGFRVSDGMSKAAVAFLTRQLASESLHTDLDVFAVCPGATNTPMFQASTLEGMSIAERESFISRLPKARLIDPSEIAAVVGFLAGSASTVLNGAVIDASMGLGVRPGVLTEYV